MSSYMWGIQHANGEVMFDTLRDSADASISVVAKRIDADFYEDLNKLGFRLVRVSVSLHVTHAVKESGDV